ncbi:MAG: polymer-forming cytoskeletal protein [Paracoccaceae bacterium]
MFSKTADPTAAPTGAPPSARPAGSSNADRSILGGDLKITGDITSSGTVEVLGEIDGNITANIVTIGQEGRISGAVNAGAVEIKGHVDGKVTCDSFTMRASAHVSADVTYATLIIESGAQIGGRFAKAKS